MGGMAVYCMKCGRETEKEDSFCRDCILDMKKYPVEPGTVVFLPRRKEVSIIKKTPKRYLRTAEEQIAFLRKYVLILSVLLAICIAAICFLLRPAMTHLFTEHFEIGQNYSSVSPTVNATAAASEK